MAVALIVAAGRGERLGGDRPKALVALAGRPLLQWSVDALRPSRAIERIVVALPAGVPAPAGTAGVRGRRGRARSRCAARSPRRRDPGDPVLVHDAARPLLDGALAERVLAALADPERGCRDRRGAGDRHDQARRRGGIVSETLERGGAVGRADAAGLPPRRVERALDVPGEVLAQATDDAWLIERAGGR